MTRLLTKETSESPFLLEKNRSLHSSDLITPEQNRRDDSMKPKKSVGRATNKLMVCFANKKDTYFLSIGQLVLHVTQLVLRNRCTSGSITWAFFVYQLDCSSSSSCPNKLQRLCPSSLVVGFQPQSSELQKDLLRRITELAVMLGGQGGWDAAAWCLKTMGA